MQPNLHTLYHEGWSLIPVNASKKPMITWKPHQTERATLEQLEQWSRDLNPAIWAGATGELSGRFTLDFDGEPGRETLRKLGWEPHRSTPRGGYHVDFSWGEQEVLSMNHNSKKELGRLFPGTDSRGKGGYINLLGGTGTGNYEWLMEDHTPYDPTLVPQELMALITKSQPVTKQRTTRTQSTAGPLPTVPRSHDDTTQLVCAALDRSVHGRNDAGFWLACQLRDAGVPLEEAEGSMRVYCDDVAPTDHAGMEAPYEWGEVLASLTSAYSQEPRTSGQDLPEVIVNGRQLSDISNESLQVMVESNEPPVVFCRGGEKVMVRSDESERTRIEAISNDLLRHRLSQMAEWKKVEHDGDDDQGRPIWKKTDAYPPLPVMRDLMAREWDDVPVLKGVVEVPTLRPDGTVLASDGYDAESGLWMNLPTDLNMPDIPEVPTADDLHRSVQLLNEALSEFPFHDDCSKANALGLILSSVLRTSIPGLIPMAVIDAPAAGTGKTYLASLASVISTGRPAPLSAAPNGNDEELRKRLTAALMTDEPIIVFDNVDRQIRSPILAQALTSETWTDRILGASKNVDVTQHAVWVATGNNVEIGGDLPRRCYVIRLDAKLAQPAQRRYERSDLLEWAREHRGELLAACFTLARHWFLSGKPIPDGNSWATFEAWRRFIGGILGAGGVAGFLSNLSELQETADPDVIAWTRLLAYWFDQYGGKPVAARTLWASLEAYKQAQELPRSLSESLDHAPGDSSRVSRLGTHLARNQDRYFTDDGLRLEQAGRDAHERSTSGASHPTTLCR